VYHSTPSLFRQYQTIKDSIFLFFYALKTPYDHAGPKGTTTELHPETTTIKRKTHTQIANKKDEKSTAQLANKLGYTKMNRLKIFLSREEQQRQEAKKRTQQVIFSSLLVVFFYLRNTTMEVCDIHSESYRYIYIIRKFVPSPRIARDGRKISDFWNWFISHNRIAPFESPVAKSCV